MSTFDITTLPQPLPQYFAIADHSATIALFADDAKVEDEGATHVGPSEIQSWLDRVETSYHPRYVVQSAETSGQDTTVTVRVSGTFPNSPIVLRQAFSVQAGKIASIKTL